MSIIINSLIDIIALVANLYIWIVIIAAILSFVNPDPNNQIVQFIYRVTEPVFNFLRRKFPFLVVSGIDLSPLVVIFGLQILIKILYSFYL
jgi:YggT family protein